MECGGTAQGGGDGFHSYKRQHPKQTSALNMLLTPNKPTSANNTPNSNHHLSNGGAATGNSPATSPIPVATATNNEQNQQCMVREQDQYMPIANVIRIMRRILPSHAKISDDAKETIQECVSEYISFITGEANERCQREQRKTVTAEDVLWAMGKLGFDDYIEPLTVFLNRYRESESDRIRTEPILRRNVDYGPQVGMMPPYGQAFQIGHVPAGMFDAMGGYYNGGGSGGPSAGNGSQL
ncbi:nuclear transcription factor Y subunit B-9-like [Benincasa hispida]|uniref:nuclear transcription factor Y subunit B-9-like n=1 Tax=Benincasa hispida TaxID=102211 RepID=UPI0018FF7A96|nr:nuclear transcription factor Y subunit B-9-like [Benincasa hispida]